MNMYSVVQSSDSYVSWGKIASKSSVSDRIRNPNGNLTPQKPPECFVGLNLGVFSMFTPWKSHFGQFYAFDAYTFRVDRIWPRFLQFSFVERSCHISDENIRIRSLLFLAMPTNSLLWNKEPNCRTTAVIFSRLCEFVFRAEFENMWRHNLWS